LHGTFGHFGHWCAVPQPLAFRLANRERGSLAVINFARIPAKIKLRNVAMQVLAADVVESSVDAALQQRES
jgi:hypothetical protein